MQFVTPEIMLVLYTAMKQPRPYIRAEVCHCWLSGCALTFLLVAAAVARAKLLRHGAADSLSVIELVGHCLKPPFQLLNTSC